MIASSNTWRVSHKFTPRNETKPFWKVVKEADICTHSFILLCRVEQWNSDPFSLVARIHCFEYCFSKNLNTQLNGISPTTILNTFFPASIILYMHIKSHFDSESALFFRVLWAQPKFKFILTLTGTFILSDSASFVHNEILTKD